MEACNVWADYVNGYRRAPVIRAVLGKQSLNPIEIALPHPYVGDLRMASPVPGNAAISP